VILSGSLTSALQDAPWINELHDFVGQTINNGIAFLGVCYGHQTLARVVAKTQVCGKAKVPEIGWTEIKIVKPSALMAGLPETFYSFSSHYEEVASLPPQLRKLAESKDCAVQAVQLEDRPVFGIQFHPERDIVGAEATFEEKRSHPQWKNDPLLFPKKSRQLFNEEVGKTIFKNFLGQL
jgi:GMP synthase (glutamine-hydrolysing)